MKKWDLSNPLRSFGTPKVPFVCFNFTFCPCLLQIRTGCVSGDSIHSSTWRLQPKPRLHAAAQCQHGHGERAWGPKLWARGQWPWGWDFCSIFRCWSSKAHSVFTRTPFGQQSFVIAQHWWTKSTTTPLLTTSHKRYGCTITKDYLVSLGIDLPSAKDVITFYASAWINVRVSSLQRIFRCSTVNSFFRELCIMFLTINISHLALYHTGGSFSWRSLYI